MATVLFVDPLGDLTIKACGEKVNAFCMQVCEEMQTPGNHVLVRESINIFSGPTSVSVGSRFYIFARPVQP